MADGGSTQVFRQLFSFVRYDNGYASNAISAQISKTLAVTLQTTSRNKKITMGVFDKLFGSNKAKTTTSNPDNNRLFDLLEIYRQQNGQGDSYKNVVLELMNGNSFLLLPSENDGSNLDAWTTAKKDTTLKLTCVFNLDGLKVLGAFTDEDALLSWEKKPTQYTALSSKDVLKLCAFASWCLCVK